MQNFFQLLAHPLFQLALRKIQHIKHLNQILYESLPADLREHCQLANIEATYLTLQVDNGAWATHLRYQAPQLLALLKTNQAFMHIESIRWQVQTMVDQSRVVAPRQALKPAKSAMIKELLIKSSQNISNEKLKNALERLANNLN